MNEKPAKKPFAKKSLGQNFLVDKAAIARIVDSVPEGRPMLLEIGPGRGALSTELFRRCETFCVLEKDDAFARQIGATLFVHGSRNHHIFHADALEFDWNRLWRETEKTEDTPLSVASNLPYNVATEILFRLLDLHERIPFLVLMFQKEVGKRIAAGPGSREYGSISVAVQIFYDVKVQQILKPGAFRPSPKVDSAVLEFHRRPTPRVHLEGPGQMAGFSSLVKAAFGHRRKTLENSLCLEVNRLSWLTDKSRNAIQEGLKEAGIEGGRRAETLSIEEFGRLYALLLGRG